MKRVLILGSAGMAGHVMKLYFEEQTQYKVWGIARQAAENTLICDVSDFKALREVILSVKPDYVINCIGILIKDAAEHPDNAILLNSYLPHFLKKIGEEYNYKLFHISTDCVFSGHRGNYTEKDFRDGDTVYARSKALGEVEDEKNCTVRTSIIGPELKNNGTGLFHWFMQQNGVIRGFSQAFWSGVTTVELAKFMHYAIEHNICGLCELTMPQKINKYDLLQLFKKIWGRSELIIEQNNDYFCDKSMISARTDINYALPENYEAMMIEQYNWIKAHYNLYPNII